MKPILDAFNGMYPPMMNATYLAARQATAEGYELCLKVRPQIRVFEKELRNNSRRILLVEAQMNCKVICFFSPPVPPFGPVFVFVMASGSANGAKTACS
jgi:hypothetical protein